MRWKFSLKNQKNCQEMPLNPQILFKIADAHYSACCIKPEEAPSNSQSALRVQSRTFKNNKPPLSRI
jgi:hypothetical protein